MYVGSHPVQITKFYKALKRTEAFTQSLTEKAINFLKKDFETRSSFFMVHTLTTCAHQSFTSHFLHCQCSLEISDFPLPLKKFEQEF
jgi:hypothetical protein